MRPVAAAILSAICVLGCSREVSRQQVTSFIDQVDAAARKRFAPEMCGLRGRNFALQLTFHGYEGREPSRMDLTRKLYCQQLAVFSHVRQYRLERKSLHIDIADDRHTATVTAQYVETLPYYEPDAMPRTPDDFSMFQVLDTRDESVVGREDGDLVILSTRSEVQQALIGKDKVQIPYE